MAGHFGDLYVSHDDGDTWTIVTRHEQQFKDVTVLPDGTLLASHWTADASGIACSVDGGRTWATRCPARHAA